MARLHQRNKMIRGVAAEFFLLISLFGNLATDLALANASGGWTKQSNLQEVVNSPVVELEVVFARRDPPRDGAQWAKLLSEIGFDRAVIRVATASDEIGIQSSGTPENPVLKVTAGMHRGQLLLPGLRANLADRKSISAWLNDLKNPEITTESPLAFGLSSSELVEVQMQLATPVSESTKDQKPAKALETLQTTAPLLSLPSMATAKAVSTETEIKMEFKGLSVGTALAAFARPRGLVLVPGKTEQGNLQLQFIPAKEPKEFWPIGWPTKKPLIDLAPQLLEKASVDLRDYTLQEALDLIALKSGVPILLDYNSLLKDGIDPNQQTTSVRLVDKNWRSIITAITTEHRKSMKVETRIDDAGKPFFWISR